MKLIIDIDEKTYKRICKVQNVSELWDMYGEKVISSISSIRNGIPYEERPQGKWIFMQGVTCGGYYKCNKCGEVERAEKNYCSNCGAEMRGKEE